MLQIVKMATLTNFFEYYCGNCDAFLFNEKDIEYKNCAFGIIEFDLERPLITNNRMRIIVENSHFGVKCELCNTTLGSRYWLEWWHDIRKEMVRFLLFKLVRRKVEIFIYTVINESGNEIENNAEKYLVQILRGRKVRFEANEQHLLRFLRYFYPLVQIQELN